MDDNRHPDVAWASDDGATEWWPALPTRHVGGAADDAGVSLTQNVPGGMDRVRATEPLLNAQRVPPGVHHDVDDPIPVTVTLRWQTGVEERAADAVEWWGAGDHAVVRIRIADARLMTGAVWVPSSDVKRR